MKKLNLSKVPKQISVAFKKRSPEILTGVGIIGMAGSAVLAVKATPKALMLIEEKKREINNAILEDAAANGEHCERIENLKPLDVVKVSWKCYIPAVVTGTLSIACLVGASSVNARRNAALAAAYTLSESAFKEYKDKVVETIGEKKEKEVKKEIFKDRLEKEPAPSKEIILSDGDVLCYDSWSGRFFKSDKNTLERVVNELNKQMIDSFNSYISLNDFYSEIGLSETKVGYELGWRLDGYDKLIELNYYSDITDDGTPYLVIDFNTRPVYDYDKN